MLDENNDEKGLKVSFFREAKQEDKQMKTKDWPGRCQWERRIRTLFRPCGERQKNKIEGQRDREKERKTHKFGGPRFLKITDKL